MKIFIEQIRAVINRADLLKYLVTSEIKIKYQNKTLGFLWAVLDPLMLMAIYILLVRVIFQRGGEQFPVLLFSALLAWRWFTYSIITSVKCLISNAKLIQTVSFPLAVMPTSRVLIGFVNYLMGLIVLIPMLFIFNATFSVNLLWFPLLIITQFIFTVGICLLVSVVGIYFKDMQNIIEFSVRLLFYLSPGLYSLTDIPEKFYTTYMILNPFAAMFSSYKNILVRGTSPNEYFILFALYGLLAFLLGFGFFISKRYVLAKHI